MKKLFRIATAIMLLFALNSCGGGASSSSGVFDGIPEILSKTDAKVSEMNAQTNSDNYQKMRQKVDEFEKEAKEEIKNKAESLNGKQLEVAEDPGILKIESPVTLLFVSMNVKAPNMGFAGKVVAAKDLTLNIGENDLKPRSYGSGDRYVVVVTMPVAMEFLDKEGNVVYERNEVGILPAENRGSNAVVKAGTPVDFKDRTFTISENMNDVVSFRMYVDLSKTPYYKSVAENSAAK